VKRFQFRLERILRLRRMLDRQARQTLATAIAERVAAETARDELRGLKEKRIRGMAVLQNAGPIDPRAVLLHELSLQALGRRIEIACGEVEKAGTVEETRADELAVAHRDMEVVARLRKDALENHNIEMRKEEMADLDEHTTRRSVMATAGESER
jgi:flagellar export protein FliJ